MKIKMEILLRRSVTKVTCDPEIPFFFRSLEFENSKTRHPKLMQLKHLSSRSRVKHPSATSPPQICEEPISFLDQRKSL